MKKSLYQEIDEFLEQELEGVDTNHHYNGGKKQAYYALSNALGMIRSIKKSREWASKNRKKKKA